MTGLSDKLAAEFNRHLCKIHKGRLYTPTRWEEEKRRRRKAHKDRDPSFRSSVVTLTAGTYEDYLRTFYFNPSQVKRLLRRYYLRRREVNDELLKEELKEMVSLDAPSVFYYPSQSSKHAERVDAFAIEMCDSFKESLKRVRYKNQITIEPDRAYTKSQAADFLSVSRKTIYNWLNRGQLQCNKMGRVTGRSILSAAGSRQE